MKLSFQLVTNLKIKEVLDAVEKAATEGLKDSLVDITNDVIKLSPKVTGHNRRSIAYKLGTKVTRRGSPRGNEKPFEKGEPDIKGLEAAVYSTSGYGGYLETGTVKMGARPYFKPALDKNIKNLPKNIKTHLGRGF